MCFFLVYTMQHSCLYDSSKPHVLGKFLSQVIYGNNMKQSDCKILQKKVLTSQKLFEV